MEISNMPEKEFKVMIIKILTGHEKRVDELRIQQRHRKYEKEPTRAEEFNN